MQAGTGEVFDQQVYTRVSVTSLLDAGQASGALAASHFASAALTWMAAPGPSNDRRAIYVASLACTVG
jgi:hypothetical protein